MIQSRFIGGCAAFVLFFLFVPQVRAETVQTAVFLDQKTVAQGFTVEADHGNFKLGIRQGVLPSASTVYINSSSADLAPQLPANKQFASSFYEYSVAHEGTPILQKPLWFFINYDASPGKRVALYVWDKNQQSWSRLPSVIDDGVVKGAIHLSYAQLAVVAEDSFSQRVSAAAVARGMNIQDPYRDLHIGLFSGLINEDVDVEIKYLDPANYVLPEGKKLVSDLFSFDLRRSEKKLLDKPFALSLAYDDPSNAVKELYYFDGNKKQWFSFPGIRFNDGEQRASGMSIFPYAVIGVMTDSSAFEGSASWYRDRTRSAGAATNLYPIGTRVRVTNVENNKQTEVKVVSTWSKDNKRVIDLVSSAFEKIAPLGQGLVRVRLEALD